jgi:hypothetical protein
MTQPNPFKSFKTSPEIIRLAVMLYVPIPLSQRIVDGAVDNSTYKKQWLVLEKVRRQALPLRQISFGP